MCKLSLRFKSAQTSQGSTSAEGQTLIVAKYKGRHGDGKEEIAGMLENNIDK